MWCRCLKTRNKSFTYIFCLISKINELTTRSVVDNNGKSDNSNLLRIACVCKTPTNNIWINLLLGKYIISGGITHDTLS